MPNMPISGSIQSLELRPVNSPIDGRSSTPALMGKRARVLQGEKVHARVPSSHPHVSNLLHAKPDPGKLVLSFTFPFHLYEFRLSCENTKIQGDC